jgi:alpha-1,2-mannosyltransferase
MRGGSAIVNQISTSKRSLALVGALGVIAVLVTAELVTHLEAPHIGMNADLLGRLTNLRTLQATGNIYLPFGREAFTYPPGAILLFWPILWTSQSLLPLVWTTISLIALVGAIFVALNHLFHRSGAWTLGASCGAAVLSVVIFPPVFEDLCWGQTGTILLLLVVLDILAVRGKAKGVLVGLATAFKIYPGVFIIVFLIRRQWRAAFNALATTAITTGLAWILWPKSASYFLTHELLGNGELVHFKAGTEAFASSSLIDFFIRPPFNITPTTIETAIAFVFVLTLGLFGARKLWSQHFEFTSMLVVLIVSAVGAPVAWDHYFVFLPLLCFVPFELGWDHVLGRTAIAVAIVMTVPWFHFRKPLTDSWWASAYGFTARNAILFAALAMLAVAAFQRLPSKHRVTAKMTSLTRSDI